MPPARATDGARAIDAGAAVDAGARLARSSGVAGSCAEAPGGCRRHGRAWPLRVPPSPRGCPPLLPHGRFAAARPRTGQGAGAAAPNPSAHRPPEALRPGRRSCPSRAPAARGPACRSPHRRQPRGRSRRARRAWARTAPPCRRDTEKGGRAGPGGAAHAAPRAARVARRRVRAPRILPGAGEGRGGARDGQRRVDGRVRAARQWARRAACGWTRPMPCSRLRGTHPL